MCAIAGSNETTWGIRSLGLFAVLIGLSLLVGFFTPVAGTLAGLGYLLHGLSLFYAADPVKHPSAITALDLCAMSLALVLLGPGSFSMDARLFGRREIIIPEVGRPRR
jgi:uncharacterized membrane protein YphA (DoxX/SURF4 family)